MTTPTNNFSIPPTGSLDPSHSYYLNPGDNPATILVIVVFNGNYYYSWSRSMRLALLAKNKLQLIDLVVVPPSPSDPLYDAWEHCNVMVLGWLYRSLAQDIAQSILWFDSAVEVWKDLQDRFSAASLVRISDLQDEVISFKQGSVFVSEYFTRFIVLWNELVTLLSFPVCSCNPRCSCGALTVLRNYEQSDQVILFLKGLNDSFSQIRSQILLMEPLPPITRVFSLVIQHERQINLTSVRSSSNPLVLAGRSSTGQCQGRGAGARQHPICSHCGIVGHTVYRCYKKHGYSPATKEKARSMLLLLKTHTSILLILRLLLKSSLVILALWCSLLSSIDPYWLKSLPRHQHQAQSPALCLHNLRQLLLQPRTQLQHHLLLSLLFGISQISWLLMLQQVSTSLLLLVLKH
ncbi:unnamed protein product [Linum trigynum]|uniref:Retrotransposon Copia-like N-terminal domain-containing protein n=1 Tax=Linum trigynum TaxID=586398 RepID=A0AAV2D8B2_9ROSI